MTEPKPYGKIVDFTPPEEDTPAAIWRKNRDPDPHGDRYDGVRRRDLPLGDVTDDALANKVFIHPTIINLTAAKDRIRWLSRENERLRAELEERK